MIMGTFEKESLLTAVLMVVMSRSLSASEFTIIQISREKIFSTEILEYSKSL